MCNYIVFCPFVRKFLPNSVHTSSNAASAVRGNIFRVVQKVVLAYIEISITLTKLH